MNKTNEDGDQAESELDEETESHELSLEAYLGLMKSTWIVENVIRPWDFKDELPQEIGINIETLIVVGVFIRNPDSRPDVLGILILLVLIQSIVDKFRKMGSLKMPDIRHLKGQDLEIWHEDIKKILVKPTSPLASPTRSTISRESTIRRHSWALNGGSSRKQSVSSGYSVSDTQSYRTLPKLEREPPAAIQGDMFLGSPPRIGEDIHQGLDDWDQWSGGILASDSSSHRHSVTLEGSESSPRQGTSHDWSLDWRTSSDRAPQSLPTGIFGLSESAGGPSPKHNDLGSSYRVRRSASASTSSTGSSGRRESFNFPYPNSPDIRSSPVPIPVPKKPFPQIIRKPVPTGDLSVIGLNITGFDQRSTNSFISEVDESESVEMIGERLVLDTMYVVATRSRLEIWPLADNTDLYSGLLDLQAHSLKAHSRYFGIRVTSTSDYSQLGVEAEAIRKTVSSAWG